ncbi:MAG TPA: TatD family hydrolase [Methylophilaceae bacterium]|nr:TatD family hydrolase [Methylophilaceae bacterium]
MLIDTHCHLDAPEFDRDRDEAANSALQQGVGIIVVPGVERSNFDLVCQLAERYAHCTYALGIHPLFVGRAHEDDLHELEALIAEKLDTSSPPVAVGEIGLDFFIEGYDKTRQEYYFSEQLKLARKYDLPVILHVRKSSDDVLKHLRRIQVRGGIAHAFNGSRQQADRFIELGFKLGFGGAMTYDRALRIRELARTLPLESIVLETDAPDIPPEWLGHKGRNTPDQLARIADVLSELRQENSAEVAEITAKNALTALPRLAQLYTPPQVPL